MEQGFKNLESEKGLLSRLNVFAENNPLESFFAIAGIGFESFGFWMLYRCYEAAKTPENTLPYVIAQQLDHGFMFSVIGGAMLIGASPMYLLKKK